MTAGSNPYEKKVIETITSNKEMREKYSAERVELQKRQKDTTNNLISLGNAAKMLECPIAIAAIEARKSEFEKELKQIEARIERCGVLLAEYESELKVLRKVCAHPATEHDSHDHHNNVDYDRCLLCGHVW